MSSGEDAEKRLEEILSDDLMSAEHAQSIRKLFWEERERNIVAETAMYECFNAFRMIAAWNEGHKSRHSEEWRNASRQAKTGAMYIAKYLQMYGGEPDIIIRPNEVIGS